MKAVLSGLLCTETAVNPGIRAVSAGARLFAAHP